MTMFFPRRIQARADLAECLCAPHVEPRYPIPIFVAPELEGKSIGVGNMWDVGLDTYDGLRGVAAYILRVFG